VVGSDSQRLGLLRAQLALLGPEVEDEPTATTLQKKKLLDDIALLEARIAGEVASHDERKPYKD